MQFSFSCLEKSSKVPLFQAHLELFFLINPISYNQQTQGQYILLLQASAGSLRVNTAGFRSKKKKVLWQHLLPCSFAILDLSSTLEEINCSSTFHTFFLAVCPLEKCIKCATWAPGMQCSHSWSHTPDCGWRMEGGLWNQGNGTAASQACGAQEWDCTDMHTIRLLLKHTHKPSLSEQGFIANVSGSSWGFVYAWIERSTWSAGCG